MRTWVALSIAAAVLASAAVTSAHHSFAATYDESTTITIKGKMVQFSFRNPHSFVQVEVVEDGKKVRWAVEWAGTTQLADAGVQGDTLKYGDEVEVTGNPGRDPSQHRLRMRTVKRPDGFSWGTRPDEIVD